MVTLRFGKDYRMDLVEGANGKKERKMIYVGPLYDYEACEDVHGKQRRFFLVLGIIAIILFILGFSFYSNISRVWFASIPYVCNLLVLYWFSESIIYFWKFRDSLTREQKEKGGDRIKSMSLIASALCLMCLVGGIVSMFSYLTAVETTDYVFLGIDIALLMIMFISFTRAKEIKYTEKINPATEEWKDK